MHHQNLTTNRPSFASHPDARQLDFTSSWNIGSLKRVIQEEGLLNNVERGKFIFRQGEIADKIYLVKAGCVAFIRRCSEGHRQVLEFFCRDSVFSDLQDDTQPATFSAQCLVDTQLYVLSKASLRRIAITAPEIYRATNSLMLSLLRQAYDNLYNVGCRHGAERVAFMLCKIVDSLNSGVEADSARWDPHIPIRQIDIADAIGVTPVYLNQILKSLKEDGAIAINKGTISINDIKILKDICSYDESYLMSVSHS